VLKRQNANKEWFTAPKAKGGNGLSIPSEPDGKNAPNIVVGQ